MARQVNGEKQKLKLMKPSTMPAGPWLEVSADFHGPMDICKCIRRTMERRLCLGLQSLQSSGASSTDNGRGKMMEWRASC